MALKKSVIPFTVNDLFHEYTDPGILFVIPITVKGSLEALDPMGALGPKNTKALGKTVVDIIELNGRNIGNNRINSLKKELVQLAKKGDTGKLNEAQNKVADVQKEVTKDLKGLKKAIENGVQGELKSLSTSNNEGLKSATVSVKLQAPPVKMHLSDNFLKADKVSKDVVKISINPLVKKEPDEDILQVVSNKGEVVVGVKFNSVSTGASLDKDFAKKIIEAVNSGFDNIRKEIGKTVADLEKTLKTAKKKKDMQRLEKAEDLIEKTQKGIVTGINKLETSLKKDFIADSKKFAKDENKSEYEKAAFTINGTGYLPTLEVGDDLDPDEGDGKVKLKYSQMTGEDLLKLDIWEELKKLEEPDKLYLKNASLRVSLECPSFVFQEIQGSRSLQRALFSGAKSALAPLMNRLAKMLKTYDKLATDGNKIAYRVYSRVFDMESKKLISEIETKVPPPVVKAWNNYARSKPVFKKLPFKVICKVDLGTVAGSVKFAPTTPAKISGSLDNLGSDAQKLTSTGSSAEDNYKEVMDGLKGIVTQYKDLLAGRIKSDTSFFKENTPAMAKLEAVNKKLGKLINDVSKAHGELSKTVSKLVDQVEALIKIQKQNKGPNVKPLGKLKFLCNSALFELNILAGKVSDAQDAHRTNLAIFGAFKSGNKEWHKKYTGKPKDINLTVSLKAASDAAAKASAFAAKKIPKPQKN